MADENSFLLINLKDDSSKDIAKVIGNETCRIILDFLANNAGSSETEISNKLKLPISTVHYNLKHLVVGKLVVADEYHYSKKGKEISHYKLANKFIIITPQETKENKNIFQKLKDIIPLSVFTVVAASVLFMRDLTSELSINLKAGNSMLDSIAPASELAREVVLENTTIVTQGINKFAADMTPVLASESTNTAIPSILCPMPNESHTIIWFLTGAISIIIFYTIYKIIKHCTTK